MKGDLIIKDVDLEQLEEDLGLLGCSVRNFFINMVSHELTEQEAEALIKVLGMLKTWAEGRKAEKAEKEDEELANALVSEQFPDATRNAAELLKQGALAGLKAQRKRLGK